MDFIQELPKDIRMIIIQKLDEIKFQEKKKQLVQDMIDINIWLCENFDDAFKVLPRINYHNMHIGYEAICKAPYFKKTKELVDIIVNYCKMNKSDLKINSDKIYREYIFPEYMETYSYLYGYSVWDVDYREDSLKHILNNIYYRYVVKKRKRALYSEKLIPEVEKFFEIRFE